MNPMQSWIAAVVALTVACASPSLAQDGSDTASAPKFTGEWKASLIGPTGSIPFDVSVRADSQGQLNALLKNGGETIPIPVVETSGKHIKLALDYYDSTIEADLISPESLKGEWRRRRGADEWVAMPFAANSGLMCGVPAPQAQQEQLRATAKKLNDIARWTINFADDVDAGVLLVSFKPGEYLNGRATVLTTTGDDRYLTANVGAGDTLTLTCFDGVHAFRFEAGISSDGKLFGTLHSGPKAEVAFQATPDKDAALPDVFSLAKLKEGVDLNALTFPNPDGKVMSLADPAFAGKARVIELFGTWCPNCRDETALLGELKKKYEGRGLSILSLAFEATGNQPRDAHQVKVYEQRLGVTWPVLIAGTNEKKHAAVAFPLFTSGIPAYPTTLFVDRTGKVRRVYVGFSGPATGKEYDKLRAQFEKTIESLLNE